MLCVTFCSGSHIQLFGLAHGALGPPSNIPALTTVPKRCSPPRRSRLPFELLSILLFVIQQSGCNWWVGCTLVVHAHACGYGSSLVAPFLCTWAYNLVRSALHHGVQVFFFSIAFTSARSSAMPLSIVLPLCRIIALPSGRLLARPCTPAR